MELKFIKVFEIWNGVLIGLTDEGKQQTILTIPETVTKIGPGAFKGCDTLRQVIISNNVKEIGEWAFGFCDALESVEFFEGSRLQFIGQSAFYKCIALRSFHIPNGVITLESNVFNGCKTLKEIEIPESVTIIGENAFSGCKSLSNHKIKKRGLFVAFEGYSGSGKTSVINAIEQKLNAEFPQLTMTVIHEKNDTAIGQEIDKLLTNNETMNPLIKTYLLAAMRTEIIQQVIQPKLKLGALVIADRFIDSSIVYQGIIGKVGAKNVKTINQCAINYVMPEIVFVLDAPLEKMMENIQSEMEIGNKTKDNLTDEERQQILNYYVKLSNTDNRYILVDASGTLEQVVEEVCERLKTALEKKKLV